MTGRLRMPGSGRFDRGTVRAAGFVALLTLVFLVTNTAVAAAADGTAGGDAGGDGLLAPLNVRTPEGALLDGYQLQADGGELYNVLGQAQVLAMSGLFTLGRLLVGLCCWLIAFVFRFPILTLLTNPAQDLADAYQVHVVGALGLKALMLAWAFVFGLVLVVRGRVGTGFGEIGMTLVIAALAASAFIRPDYLLGRNGPLDQTHQAALEVASITSGSYFDGSSSDPCDAIAGPGRTTCEDSGVGIAKPVQDALTDALVVKPYMLLQYGRILDPEKDKDAYKAHVAWVKSSESAEEIEDDPNGPCAGLEGVGKETCENTMPGAPEADFDFLITALKAAGPVGEAAAEYAVEPSWDRVGAALALLIAVIIVAAMVVSMAMLMLGAQGADAAAAAAGPVVWVWAMLPGPPRTVLWRWVGVFVTSALVTFAAAMGLPMFGIAVDALLSDSGPDLMVERLLLLDALAIAFLTLHKRIAASASSIGQRMAMRLQYAGIGGSHAPRGALTAGMYAGGGIGKRGGAPFSLGRAVYEARTATRLGLAPVSLALRGAHAALIGRKPADRHPAAKALAAAIHQAGGGPRRPVGEMQLNARTGEVLHDPATDRPLLSTRFHQHASRLRGYRIAHRAGRIAYGSSIGLPRTIHAGKAAFSEFTDDARTQFRVTANRTREDWDGWSPVTAPVAAPFMAAGRAARRGTAATGRYARNSAISAALYTAPITGTGGPAAGRRGTISQPDPTTAPPT
ncbi:hypothetical protein ACWCQL_32110, partial [Streptomyces sp. NPDC002073]